LNQEKGQHWRRIKLSEKQSDRAIRVVEFLKALGANPDRRMEDIAHDLQIPRSSAYNWSKNFVWDVIQTDADPDKQGIR